MSKHLTELFNRGQESRSGTLRDCLASYSTYLALLSRVQLRRQLRGKVDPADVVQDTLMEAHRQLPNFRGNSAPEFGAWLRQILAGQIALVARRFATKGRNVNQERSVSITLDHSHDEMFELAAALSTPSVRASRREQVGLLNEALTKLPADYRDVIRLRHVEELSFALIAERLGRSEDAVQKLWVRSLAALKRTLGDRA